MLLEGPVEARHLSKHGLEALDSVRVRGRGTSNAEDVVQVSLVLGYPYISVGFEFPRNSLGIASRRLERLGFPSLGPGVVSGLYGASKGKIIVFHNNF